MPIKKVRREPVYRSEEPPKKEKVVKEPKKKEVKPKQKDIVTAAPAITPPVIDTPVITEKQKKDYDGISLVGSHPEITKFKGKVKMNADYIGKVLLDLMKEYNSRP